MKRLYVNENFPLPVVKLLREFGHDVLTSLEAGNANQRIPDEVVLDFATSQNRILLTLNRRDFMLLHKLSPHHAGIIVCTSNPDFKSLAEQVHSVLISNDDFPNTLFRVYKPV